MSLARSSHSAPVFQASAELAALKDENVTLRANDAQPLQPSPAAVPSSTTNGSAANDAEPDETASECTSDAASRFVL